MSEFPLMVARRLLARVPPSNVKTAGMPLCGNYGTGGPGHADMVEADLRASKKNTISGEWVGMVAADAQPPLARTTAPGTPFAMKCVAAAPREECAFNSAMSMPTYDIAFRDTFATYSAPKGDREFLTWLKAKKQGCAHTRLRYSTEKKNTRRITEWFLHFPILSKKRKLRQFYGENR